MKAKNGGYKIFVVKKYVMARNVQEACRVEQKQRPDEVHLDADWTNGKSQNLAEAMGFVA